MSALRPSARPTEGAARWLGVVVFHDVKDGVEEGEGSRIASRSPASIWLLVERGVGSADESKMGARASAVLRSLASAARKWFRLVRRGLELGLSPRLSCASTRRCVEGAQAFDGGGCLNQAVEGEVDLVAVGHGDERESGWPRPCSP